MSKSVLVVEDDRTVRKLISGFLDKINKFNVVGEAVDGADGVEMALRLKPDAVVLDLVMPKMNGAVAAARIKEALPRAAIVIFSSHDQSIRKYVDGNIDAIVSKSEGLEKLAAELNRILTD